MRVLIVKTSSLGDLVHTLPAVTDAAAAIPGIAFDWVAEEAFGEIPAAHPAVQRVIPIALRRWRRERSCNEIPAFLKALRRERYDLIIDAQGLMFKSALVALLARGPCAGYDRRSARDPWVALTYRRGYAVAREQHAIARIRQLFARALGYRLPEGAPAYGLNPGCRAPTDPPALLLLHGTTWPSKHWPERYWAELIRLALRQGLSVQLPWGSEAERQRAERLAEGQPQVRVLPRMGLAELMPVLRRATGVIGLDSGLSHLAAALAVPGVTIYGATRQELTGVVGVRHRNLVATFPCAPCLKRHCGYAGASSVQPACYEQLTPARVWSCFREQAQWEAA